MTTDPATPFPDIAVYGHGGLGPPPGLASLTREGAGAIIRERGCRLVLHFASSEQGAPLLELRIGPDIRGKRLDPAQARHLIPQLDLYLAAARAALDWDEENVRAAAEALRQVGRPGRGLSDDFFRLVAVQYKALVAEGERYPTKALAAMQPGKTNISTASRWIAEARRRGYLPPKEAKKNAR